jgi:hypothetical protein
MRVPGVLLLLPALAACMRDSPEAAPDVSPASLAPTVVHPPGPTPRTADPAPGQLPYVMVRDPVSDAVLPRLTDTLDPRFRAVNRQLDSISGELRCLDKVAPSGEPTEHWSLVEVAHAADSIFSVKMHFGGFCGGAHPIKGENVSVTYDLRTGRPVEFRALFADWERDARAIVRVMYTAHVAAAARMEAEGREPGPEDEDACVPPYSEDALAGWMYYWMTDAGLVVEPSLGYAAHACTEESLVPYARLRPFAAPGGLLERMAER